MNCIPATLALLCMFASCDIYPVEDDDPCTKLAMGNYPTPAYTCPLWCPSGDSIIFIHYPRKSINKWENGRTIYAYEYDMENMGIYSLQLRSGELKRIHAIRDLYDTTNRGVILEWARDGSFILRVGSGWYWAMSPDCLVSRPITQFYVPSQWGGISPDMQKLVFTRNYRDEHWLWVINTDGSNLRRIYKGAGSPKWMPDNTIAAIIGGDGISKTFLGRIDTNGKFIDTIGAYSPRFYHFKISPDGRYIAYTQNKGPFALYVAKIDGSGRRQLESDWVKDFHFDWSPGSDAVVYLKHNFCVWSLDNDRLWLAGLDGSKRQLTFTP